MEKKEEGMMMLGKKGKGRNRTISLKKGKTSGEWYLYRDFVPELSGTREEMAKEADRLYGTNFVSLL